MADLVRTGPFSDDARALMRFQARRTSVGAAYLLWLTLGAIGAHRLYTGRPVTAAILTVLTVLGAITAISGLGLALLAAVGLWWLADAFRVAGWVRDQNLKLIDQLAG